MNLLDMRTVIISHTISSVINMVIMILLWMQNRKRFAGLGFWLANSIIQLVAIALIFLRGVIPDFLSIVAGNGLIVFGGFLLYIGLEKFTGKQTNQLHNCLLLATFILIHSYYTFVQPNLLARNINISLALFLLSCQNAWLMLRRVTADMRPITGGVGFIASAFSLIYIARIVLDSIIPIGDDFLRSNPYDTLIIMASQMLFIILAFGLTLMVNRRLISNLEQDINERKQTENALLEREKLYRQMFTDHTALMLLINPASGQIIEANPAAANFYGYPVEMLQNMKIDQINTSPPTKVAKDRQAATTGDQNYFVFSHRLASGEIRDVEVHSVPIQIEGSTLLYSIIHDITERKQAEDALLESEEKFYTAFHASPVVMAISTMEGGVFIDANTQFFKLTGYERQEVLGKTSTELGLWSNELRQNIVEELKEYGYAHRKEVDLITKSGEPVPILWFGDVVHIDNTPCLISSGYDLREQKQAEAALQESEAFSQAVLKNSPIGVSVRSRTGQLLSANEAWRKIWAIPESAVLEDLKHERETLDFNDRDDYLLQHQTEIRHIYEQGGYLHLPELKTTHPRPGGAEWISQHFYAIKDEKGQVERVVILTEDISARKRTESALQENENRLRTIFETSQAGIILVDSKGIITYANQRMADMFGLPLNELVGSPYPEHVHPDQRYIGDERMRQLIAGEIDFVSLERHYIRKDDSDFWGHLSGRRHEDESGNLISLVGNIADITESKQSEAAIRDALHDKEVLLRELYHRTKNNMQVISSMLNLEIGQTENKELEKTLRDMDNRIRSMALVHQKLYQSQNLSSLDLKDYITDLANLMLESYQINPGHIEFSLQAESVPVLIDTAIPCGLIVNEILSNALKYAFPDKRKGAIQIRLERTKDATIVLQISDNGVGVPPEKDLRKNDTLGIQTIFGIAGHQLDATVELETNNGVAWSIQFEDNLYTSRI